MLDHIHTDNIFDQTPEHYLVMGIYYGLALMSVIFNFVFYLVFKNKSFIAYCLLLLTTIISFFYEDGLFYYLSDGRWPMEYLTAWNSSITAIAALSFTYHFLGLETTFRIYRKWYILVSLLLLLGALTHTLTKSDIVLQVVLTTCFIFALSCIYLAIRRFKQDIYARFLVLAFTLLVLTGILYALHTHTAHAAFAWFDISTFRLFSAIEIIGISFAIIFRVKALQQENEFYRQELTQYLHELEESRFEVIMEEKELTENFTEKLVRQYDLTDREAEVLQCIWEGLTNREIADKLFITLSTAKYHTSNLYNKLEVKNRLQAQVLVQQYHQ